MYAFDRSFEGAVAACAAPVVGAHFPGRFAEALAWVSVVSESSKLRQYLSIACLAKLAESSFLTMGGWPLIHNKGRKGRSVTLCVAYSCTKTLDFAINVFHKVEGGGNCTLKIFVLLGVKCEDDD